MNSVHLEVRNENVVVVIKHTKMNFEPHKEDFYRDHASKRNGYENNERPKDPELAKYWSKRYYLFSKFDRGIRIDDESWYSVTPEPMAKHIAARVEDQCSTEEIGSGGSNVLDAFCGVGGNLIQFSRKCGFCVGSDMDPLKVQNANHNSEIYNL